MKRALEAWPTVLGQTASNHGRKLIRPAQQHGRNDRFRRLGDTGQERTTVGEPGQRESAFDLCLLVRRLTNGAVKRIYRLA